MGLQQEMQDSRSESGEIPTRSLHHLDIYASQVIFAKRNNCCCGCLAVWWELALQTPSSDRWLWLVNEEER